MTQLSFPNMALDDDRPLPLVVSDRWGFDLTHIERDDDTLLYSVRDWFLGLGGSQPQYSLTTSSDWFGSTNAVEIEVKRPRRPVEKLPFCTDKGLYLIAQNMREMKNRPQLTEIKNYLAKAGALVDEMRRDPDTALGVAHGSVDRLDRPDAWKQSRKEGMWSRAQFTAELTRVCPTLNIGQATNTEYRGLFGKNASELRSEMGLTKSANLRNHMAASDLHLIGFIEAKVAELFRERESAPEYECLSVIATISGYAQTLRLMAGGQR